MAILPMKKIHLVALNQDRKPVVSFLQRQGVIELSTPEPDSESSVFSPHQCQAVISEIIRKTDFVHKSLEVLKEYSTEKKSMFASLEGRKSISVDDYEAFEMREPEVFEMAEEICRLYTHYGDLNAERIRCEHASEELAPWYELQVPLNYQGTKHTTSFVGSVPGTVSYNDFAASLAETAPTLEATYIEILDAGEEQTTLMVTGLKTQQSELKLALDDLDFRFPQMQTDKIPEAAIAELEEKIVALTKEMEETTDKISSFSIQQRDLEFLADYYSIQKENQMACTSLSESKHTFLLEGYLPEQVIPSLEKELNKRFSVMLGFSNVTNEEAPVLLKNGWFSEPTESIVTSYSYPGPGEVDPTSVMSIFYYIMFGLMFSDAGYGFVLALACGLLLNKFKNMEPSTNKTLRTFFWCGVSTTFWGIVFSSYFGNVVEAVTGTFFGKAWNIPPLWFNPVENPMRLLVFCMAIGLVHLSAGYVMKGITCAKAKDTIGILIDSVVPILFIIPVILIFMQTQIFHDLSGFSITLPATVAAACKYLAIATCIATVLFAGRDSANWGVRIAQGLYSLYNLVSGWLSDILSYSRLLALGLATGIIGTVINTLGVMGGNSVFGAIIFILVFVFGHLLNFGINILGAYVHSNRLEYVEFFGKFYEGGGRGFAPFGIHTKHYKFREETNYE